MDESGKEGESQIHEARIPSSRIENYPELRGRLKEIRSIQDINERKLKFAELLQKSPILGAEGSLHDEMWEQLARIENEGPTNAEKSFTQESKYAASQVAGKVSDLKKPVFEGLVIRTDGDGNVSDILVKQVLPGDNAERVTKGFGLDNLPNSSAKKFDAHVPDAPDNALKTRIPVSDPNPTKHNGS